MSGPTAAREMRLPPLREELHLHEGPRNRDGSPSWTLEDPARSRFFRIGWSEVEMLAQWELRSPARIAEAICKATPLDVYPEDVEKFALFLAGSNLLRVSGDEANARLLRQAKSERVTGLMWLLKNYLFVRIPLFRPDRFLSKTVRYVAPFYTKTFLIVTLCAAVVALFLVGQQWDVFRHTFSHFFTLEGAALAGLTLIFAKVMHEFGHAYTAKRFGCRVSTMGVAFLVMWPVLYTDTSGAWKLKSRNERLAIGAAGMTVELGLAAYATLAWNFLPDGMLRSAVFMLGTTTWILTMVINLNPFMRYDGYYLASDFVEVPNLQERAFRLTKWRLREWLFGFGEAHPDGLDPALERWVIAYGFGTLIYRFLLFTGIALLVYHYFFKALGIVLFAVEIGYFIVRPIASELLEWVKRREHYSLNRNTKATLTLAATILLLLLIPWRITVTAPALLRAEQQAEIYAPAAARLDAILVKPGQRVSVGQVLFRFSAPDLDYQLAAAEWQILVLRWQDVFQILDKDLTPDTLVVHQQLQAALAERAAVEQKMSRLTVTAPFAGVLTDLADPLGPGEWVKQGEFLGRVISPDKAEVEAFVAESDVARIAKSSAGRFVGEDPSSGSVGLVVENVARTASRQLSSAPELASVYGGGVAAANQKDQAPVPEGAVYRVVLAPRGDARAPVMAERGAVSISGRSQSIAMRLWLAVHAALVRENGF